MPKLLFALILALGAHELCGQQLQLFTTKPDAEEKKFLFGIVAKSQITGDADFTWYEENAKYAKPNSAVVETVKAAMNKVELVLFVGTWCHDTHQLLPKYFKTLEAAGFPEERLTIFATDRDKATIANMHKVFRVIDVPTMIVLQDGKEVGRIVEFGETGLVDKELGEIMKLIK